MARQNCPNCSAEIKTGVFDYNPLIEDPGTVRRLNRELGRDNQSYCSKCIESVRKEAAAITAERQQQIAALSAQVQSLLPAVPVLSLQLVPTWSYDPIALVTAQSVSGTGLVADFTSTFADMFGRQSGKFRDKISQGEQMCLADLRLQALRLKGHAVIGADIDYAEVGGAKSMLMVCMTGTAVRLRDLTALGEGADNLRRATEMIGQINALGAT